MPGRNLLRVPVVSWIEEVDGTSVALNHPATLNSSVPALKRESIVKLETKA
jgi:hypothetical protein